MKRLLITLVLGVCTSTTLLAQATKPADATGICKDGTYTTEAAKSGACRGHHGVKEWYTAAPTPATPAAAMPAPTASTPSPTTQARTQNQAAAQSAAQTASDSGTSPATQSIHQTPPPPAEPAAIAPGAAPGLVWLNTGSHVYHCPGTPHYGKTKHGAYMTEIDAKSKGAHGVRNKPCPKQAPLVPSP